jgi:hypothetical protein
MKYIVWMVALAPLPEEIEAPSHEEAAMKYTEPFMDCSFPMTIAVAPVAGVPVKAFKAELQSELEAKNRVVVFTRTYDTKVSGERGHS